MMQSTKIAVQYSKHMCVNQYILNVFLNSCITVHPNKTHTDKLNKSNEIF